MRGKHILFCDRDIHARRVAERALGATGSTVEIIDDPRSISDQVASRDFDLLIIGGASDDLGDAGFIALLDRLTQARAGMPVVILATGRPEDYLPLMQQHSQLRHLIARTHRDLDPDELIITAEKLLRRDLFGVEKYLLWGAEPLHFRIRSTDEKQRYLRQVAEYTARLGCRPRVAELIENVADELLTNAIFNAPRNPDGSAKYATQCRRAPVILEDHEVGELQIASDGSFLAVAQRDPFGALAQDTIISYLNRCMVGGPEQLSHRTGGAGIGLFRIFQSSSKFVINIEPGNRTEVISLLDLRLSMKSFRLAPKSFHIFIADNRARSGVGRPRTPHEEPYHE